VFLVGITRLLGLVHGSLFLECIFEVSEYLVKMSSVYQPDNMNEMDLCSSDVIVSLKSYGENNKQTLMLVEWERVVFMMIIGKQ